MPETVSSVATIIAKWRVFESWITQSPNRHADQLTTEWSTSINRDHLNANSRVGYT